MFKIILSSRLVSYRDDPKQAVGLTRVAIRPPNSGLLKKRSAGWIQILRTGGALPAQTLGYAAASE
jgi:hypothetical protein